MMLTEVSKENQKFLDKYLSICETSKGLTKKTIKGFSYDIRLFLRFIGNKPLSEVAHHDCEDFMVYCHKERKNGSQALNRKFTALNGFFKELIRKDYIDMKNPMDKLDKPKIRKKVKDYLTENELKLIFDFLEGQNDLRGLAFFHLAYSSACRIGELYQLDIISLDMNERKFKVRGKGEKERICFMSEIAKEHIQRYLDSRNDNLPALFVSRENNRWSIRSMQNFVVNVAKKVGIKKHITPHSIRHSILTHMRLKGYPLEDLQLLAGHENIGTTQQIYVHVGLDNVRDKLDEFHNAIKV